MTERPIILGVVHGWDPAKGSKSWRTEKKRVSRLLSKLPRGTPVGIEITPYNLAKIKNAGPDPLLKHRKYFDVQLESVLYFSAKLALSRGLKVVPLNTDSQIEKLHETLKSNNYRNFMMHAYAGSLGFARKIISGKLPLSIIGDAHAVHLAPWLGETHDLRASPFRGELTNEEKFFSRPENAGLKKRLHDILKNGVAAARKR